MRPQVFYNIYVFLGFQLVSAGFFGRSSLSTWSATRGVPQTLAYELRQAQQVVLFISFFSSRALTTS
jgi:hypothetical protein